MENSLKRALSLLLYYPLFVMAHVEDPHVVAGEATFENPAPNTQTIHAADKTIINCKSLNVGKDEIVHFIQDQPKHRVLCRVTGKQASMIEGTLKADGRLFLINPNSIFFRETAQVNVHSLIASTLNIKDEDFVKGNFRFLLDKEAKESAIVNKGQITAAQDVVFMAPQIINQAVVKAVAGRVAFLGGEIITLNFEGDNLISFAIDGDLKSSFIQQAGQIEAGQEVLLKLRVADEMIKSVVNTAGIEEARGMQFENGKIYLVAGSSIAAPKIKAEAPLVQTAGNFTKAKTIEITAGKEFVWQGGLFNGTLNSTDVALNAPSGTLTINAPFGKNKDDKAIVKTLSLKGKIIDQNGPIKTGGSITYLADEIFLSADTHAVNSPITYNGPVIIDGANVNIQSGQSKGDIIFNGTVDADQSSRSLTIKNGKGLGTVFFQKPIRPNVPFNLTVETGKLSLPDIGDQSRAGVEKLHVKALKVDLLGTVVNAKEQMWGEIGSTDAYSIYLKSGKPTSFIVHEKPLTFTSKTQVILTPKTDVGFETQGGYFELSKLSGNHDQSITINTGRGESQIGEFEENVEFSGKLGHLDVQSRNIYVSGKIKVSSIFMEAQEHISYATEVPVETTKISLLSVGEVTLNAKRGMIGTQKLPLIVKTPSKLILGAKSFAYIDGTCAGDFPEVYPSNKPPRIVYNGFETQYSFNADIFMEEEEELMSLTPDLFHTAPHGFVDSKNFIPRRAPIYYVK